MIILLLMLFLHIVDDYYLQGILAKLKQKSWWEENANDPLYKNDYLMALFEHAFSWAFVVMLPIMNEVYLNKFNIRTYLILFLFNFLSHAGIDNMKANRHKINLITDQILHILQILTTWIVYMIFINGS